MNEGTSSEAAPAGRWMAGSPAALWVYLVVLPVLVATLPGWVALWGAVVAGWQVRLGPWLCAPALLWVVGLLWARQVLAAATDELARRVTEGRVAEALGARMAVVMTRATYGLVLVLPLALSPAQQAAERSALRWSSGPALRAVAESFEAHCGEWRQGAEPGRAFRPDDPAFEPAGFGGRLATTAEDAVGKVAFDEAGRGFYILDRRTGLGPGLWPRLQTSLHLAQNALSRRSEEAAERWRFERGLVFWSAREAPPETTVWGVPMVRVTPLGRRHAWYVAARPEDRPD